MKQKLYLLLAGLLLLTLQLKAQAPNAFDYQAVARTASGAIMPNTAVGLRFTIRKTSAVGTIVYQEQQSATTNDFGLFSVAIGSGIVLNGSMAAISWGTDSYYLQVEMVPTGGTVYINMGSTQLLSVPYALYALSGGTKPKNYVGGTGIVIEDTIITADAADALWNASKLQGDSISVTAPTDGQILQWNGVAWAPITYNSGWNLTGNSGTTASTDFVGTTDANDLVLKANNKEGLRINHTSGNVGIGTITPAQTLDVEGGNIQFGKALMPGGNAGNAGDILQSNGPNTAPTWVGGGWSFSGNSGTSYPNNYIGTTDDNAIQFEVNSSEAGMVEDYDGGSGGNGNTGLGYQVLYNNYNSGGYQNTAMGFNAMYNGQYTSNNAAFGYQALYNDYSTSNNTAIGFQALFQNDQYYDEDAFNNTALGSQALYSNIDATNNVAVGYQALYNNDNDDANSASYNTAVGTLALSNDVDGGSNTAIGFNANFGSSDQGNPISNSTAIGANSIVNSSNTVQLGRSANIQFDQALMPFNGSTYDAGGVGEVLQSNGPNAAPTWVVSSGGGGAWALNGNTGTVYPDNYLGTTDDNGLQFEVNGNEAGLIEDNDGGTGGTANTAIGYQALQDNLSSGIDNTGVGYQALQATNGSGWYNAAYGFQSMVANTNGQWNAAYGTLSLTANVGGQKNVAIGSPAMYGNTSGSFNTAIGTNALNSNQTGTEITALGYLADVGADGLNDATAIGANAIVSTSNTIVLGDNNVTEFDFNGSLTPWNGSSYDPGTAGYVLQSNGPGTAPSWVAAGGGGASWNLSGNAVAYSYSATPTTFLGTTNSYGFEFGVNGVEAGRVEANFGGQNTALGWGSLQNGTGSANTAMGINAAQLATGGNYNVAIGWEAFGDYSDGGSQNVAVGGGALAGPGGSAGDGDDDNTAVGYFALVANDAADNTAFGYGAASSGLNSSPATNLTGTPITAIGFETLFNNTTGSDNVALGFEALNGNTVASNNTAIGDYALQNNDNDGSGAGQNIAVGYEAMQNNTDGYNDLGVGYQVMQNAGSGNSQFHDNTAFGNLAMSVGNGGNEYENTAVGYQALENNTGSYNTAVGSSALGQLTSGLKNVAFGESQESNQTGSYNVSVGQDALSTNTGSNYNTGIGVQAATNTTGADNTALGYNSLATNGSGSNNTALGYQADVSSNSLTNATAIGANAIVGESNALVLGGTGVNAVNVGINTTTPNSSLQISGGTLSLPITVSASSVDLSTAPNTYTVIITATGQTVTLPTALTCTGRVYVISAQFASGSLTTSTFNNSFGVGTTSVAAGSIVTIQSDGTNWDQIR